MTKSSMAERSTMSPDNHVREPHEGGHHAGETITESVMIENTLPESSAMEKTIRVHGGKLHNGHDHVGQPHEGEHHARDTIP